jgi:endogenous inhibitor of DNA gyrase (YacG/DUF329 family)
MPYQATKNVVERVKNTLDSLMSASGDVTIPSQVPHKLAFQIHNAVAICAQFPEFIKYATLKGKYKVRVRAGKVLCELRAGDTSPVAVSVAEMSKMSFDNVTTIEGVVGAMVENKPSEGYFPNCSLNAQELIDLWRWADTNHYHIIDHEDAGVTVTRENSELVFKPEME